MENFGLILPFSFFELLTQLAHFFTNGFKTHFLYLEFPLIGTTELLESLVKDYPLSEKEVFLILGNSSLLVLTPEPNFFLKHLKKQEFYQKFLRGKLNIATLNLRKFEHYPSNILKRLYEKAKGRKRYLHVPNIEGYKRLAELLLSGVDEISVDLPEENPFLSIETLQLFTTRKVAFVRDKDAFFLKLQDGTKFKTIKLNKDIAPQVKIDTITVEDVHKALQAYFITPNISREILELFYYRSMYSFSKFLWLLKILDSKNFFRWDENSGWILIEDSKFPYEEYCSARSKELFEWMNKEEKLITYMILSSAHPMDKTDIIKLFPTVKTETIEKVIGKLSDNRIVKGIKNKIYSTHPVIEYTFKLGLPEQEVRKIHGNYAQLLHTRRMSNFSIASWVIGRHFELSGDSRNAFKYYCEAINEEVKKEQFDKALHHAKKAKLLAKTKKQKSSIRETIINLYTKIGEYNKTLDFIKTLEDEKNNHGRYKKIEIELLTEIGEINAAAQMLKDYLSTQKRIQKDLLLLKFSIDYKADRMEYDTELLVKKLERVNSPHNGKTKILEALGDWEFYRNKIKKATEYYLKALKASTKMEESTLLRLKLAEMLLLNFKFRGALNYIENVLWSMAEIKNKHLKETLLGEIGKIYLYLLPQSSFETFVRSSIDDILNTNPKTNYPFYLFSGLILIHSGSVQEGYNLARKDIDYERQRGNFFKANLMTLTLTHHLLKHNELKKAQELLEEVETRSEYIFARKKLLEKLMEILKDNSIKLNIEEMRELAQMNALNALIFFEVTENLKNVELDNIRSSLINKFNDLKSALAEVDLLGYYSN